MSLIEFQLLAGGYTFVVFALGILAGVIIERNIK